MYRVGMRSNLWTENYLFVGYIEEVDGYLKWVRLLNERQHDKVPPNVTVTYTPKDGGPFTSLMVNRDVMNEEAETITGLHMPAAMDRLRELVHESGGG